MSGDVDWRQVIFDLMDKELSPAAIAALVNVSRTTVLRWRDNGAEPFYRYGHRLLDLWQQRCGVKTEE